MGTEWGPPSKARVRSQPITLEILEQLTDATETPQLNCSFVNGSCIITCTLQTLGAAGRHRCSSPWGGRGRRRGTSCPGHQLASALPADGSWRAARTYPMAAPQLPQVTKGEAFRWTLRKSLPRCGLCKAL